MFVRWFISIFLNAVALVIVAQLFDGFHLEGFGTALIASIVLSILNFIVRPILVALTLPITVVTLGLFLLVINAVTLMIAQAIIGDSFVIDGFITAIIAAIIISIISTVLHRVTGQKK